MLDCASRLTTFPHSMVFMLTRLLAPLLLCLSATVWAQTAATTPSTTGSAGATGLTVKRMPPRSRPKSARPSSSSNSSASTTPKKKLTPPLKTKPEMPNGAFWKACSMPRPPKTKRRSTPFESLREEFPELAEPYNNLAVLYQRRGEYQRARVALEQPSSIGLGMPWPTRTSVTCTPSSPCRPTQKVYPPKGPPLFYPPSVGTWKNFLSPRRCPSSLGCKEN